MAKFPWPGHVLFDGQFYKVENLPISYLPTLLNIQLTETLLLLTYMGLSVLILFILYKRVKLDFLLVIVVGTLLPLIGLMLSRASLYDNFRQLLFLLPPLILLSGLALDLIFSILKSTALRLILFTVLAFSGIYPIIQLHPYQYIYYNSLVGGTGGAFRKFELDYWFTAYHDAALWLNNNASPKAKIGGEGPTYLLYAYLRSDLKPQHMNQADEQYDYFTATSRYNQDLALYPDAEVIHSIERNGAILTAIKQLSP